MNSKIKSNNEKKGEISDKLANELLEIINKIDDLSCKKAKEGRPSKWDADSDWVTIACWAEHLRQHILWHVQKSNGWHKPQTTKT